MNMSIVSVCIATKTTGRINMFIQVNDTVIALAVTQVTVERTFSGLNYILNDLRFRMKEDIVDDIMVLRTNV